MPKWRHDNAHAERRIVELDLLAWESQRARQRRAREGERREREAAALRAVPWAELTPAELAFRFVVERADRSPYREIYAAWCAEARAAFAARCAGGHTKV